jgi:hypothetical protein
MRTLATTARLLTRKVIEDARSQFVTLTLDAIERLLKDVDAQRRGAEKVLNAGSLFI